MHPGAESGRTGGILLRRDNVSVHVAQTLALVSPTKTWAVEIAFDLAGAGVANIDVEAKIE